MIDVLDRHGAFVDAGATGDAVPDDVGRHRVTDESRWLERLASASRREELRAFREDLVAKPHDQQLRGELLPRGIRRADVLAAPALGAGHRVDHLLPGHVGNGRRPEPELGIVLCVESQRLEPPAGACPPEPHVDARRCDVQVLRMRQVGEEPEHEEDVRPHEGALEHLRRVTAAEEVREAVRDRGPARGPFVRGRARSVTHAREAAWSRCRRSTRESGRPRRGDCP